MQLLNNKLLGDNEKRIQQAKIIGVLILLAITVMFILFFSSGGKKTATSKTDEYRDPGSGETVSSPVGKATEPGGGGYSALTLFLGFSRLLERGLTKTQLDKTKSILQNYSTTNNNEFRELSLTTSSISVTPPETGSGTTETVITAELTANRIQKYQLRISYDNIRSVRVSLIKDGKQVLDSGVPEVGPEDLGDN